MVREKVKVRTLESLVGKLNFLSKAVRGGRAFNRRFYDAMIGISNPDFYIRLNSAALLTLFRACSIALCFWHHNGYL